MDGPWGYEAPVTSQEGGGVWTDRVVQPLSQQEEVWAPQFWNCGIRRFLFVVVPEDQVFL